MNWFLFLFTFFFNFKTFFDILPTICYILVMFFFHLLPDPLMKLIISFISFTLFISTYYCIPISNSWYAFTITYLYYRFQFNSIQFNKKYFTYHYICIFNCVFLQLLLIWCFTSILTCLLFSCYCKCIIELITFIYPSLSVLLIIFSYFFFLTFFSFHSIR